VIDNDREYVGIGGFALDLVEALVTVAGVLAVLHAERGVRWLLALPVRAPLRRWAPCVLVPSGAVAVLAVTLVSGPVQWACTAVAGGLFAVAGLVVTTGRHGGAAGTVPLAVRCQRGADVDQPAR
jgi:hypothetical protein